MSVEKERLHLPPYDDFVEAITVLSLNESASFLHGMMCGYICAGADSMGEAYMRALLNNKKDATVRNGVLAMFAVFAVSQQYIINFDFEFEMMLPDDNKSLLERAKGFSEWCGGFIRALNLAGVVADEFYEEEAQEAMQHLIEFSELDCNTLDVAEDDERALMEVTEYARMAVIRLYGDLVMNERERDGSDKTH